MNTNKILSMATMLVLGTAMQTSLAQSMTTPYKIGFETADVGSSGTFVIPTGTNFEFSVLSGKLVSSTAPYYVVVTLTGGAQFSGSGVDLQCGYSATIARGANTGATAQVDSPVAAANSTVAAFKLQSASSNGAVTSCQLAWSGGSGIILTSGNKDYGMSIANRYDEYNASASSTLSGPFITFVQGVQASVSAGSVTIDVVSPSLSKNFLITGSVMTGSNVGLSTTAVADLGVIRYTPTTGIYDLAGNQVTAGTYLKTATLLVSGGLIAGAVTATSGSTVTGIIFLAKKNDGTTAVVCSSTLASAAPTAGSGSLASGNQISFDVEASYFATGIADSGIHVCMIANGVSLLEKGTVSFQLTSKSSQNSSTPNLSIADSTLVKVVKNGTSVKVLNIPSPDYTVDVAYIRFYNMGSTTGKIYGTLYNQGKTDGTNEGGGGVIGSASTLLVDSLSPGQVVALSGPALAAKFGATTWPGRAWLQVESEVKGLRVQSLVRSNGPSGTLANMSDRVMADGEIQQRNE